MDTSVTITITNNKCNSCNQNNTDCEVTYEKGHLKVVLKGFPAWQISLKKLQEFNRALQTAKYT